MHNIVKMMIIPFLIYIHPLWTIYIPERNVLKKINNRYTRKSRERTNKIIQSV